MHLRDLLRFVRGAASLRASIVRVQRKRYRFVAQKRHHSGRDGASMVIVSAKHARITFWSAWDVTGICTVRLRHLALVL
jgi:hypothetical protein